MNITRSIPAAAFAAALMAVPGLGMAQGFEGAEISASFGSQTGSSGYSFGNYQGGARLGIGAGISVELDFGLRDWRGYTTNASVMTFHGIYEIAPGTSAGLYYAREWLHDPSASATSYGIEGATQLGPVDIAGYLGRLEDASRRSTLIGLDAAMSLGNAFALTGGIDSASGDIDYSTVTIGGEYRMGAGPTLFANLGRETSGSMAVDYISVGARVTLGDGLTFGNRGLLETMPLP